MPAAQDGKGPGAHYTSDDVADTLTRNALRYFYWETSRRDRHPHVLDPSCGDGAMLKAAYRAGVPLDNLIGIDLNEEAVESTRQWVASAYAAEAESEVTALHRKLACEQVWQDDFLLPEKGETLQMFDGTKDWVDIVLGNPPWIGQVSRNLGGEYAKAVAAAFKPYNAASDLCAAFLRQSAKISCQVALLCTKTITEGRTNRSGLKHLVQEEGWNCMMWHNGPIIAGRYSALKETPRHKWPGKASVLYVELHMSDPKPEHSRFKTLNDDCEDGQLFYMKWVPEGREASLCLQATRFLGV